MFEIIGGIWTNSLAIITDDLHDLGDSLSVGHSLQHCQPMTGKVTLLLIL
ncbi:MAG: hypothetical protein AB4426_22885 [Xenococcaceae cyanobacterium]